MDRFDARLTAIPAAACHEFAVRISRIDEFKGWWAGRSNACPSILRRLRTGTIASAAEASARIAAGASLAPAGHPAGGPGRGGRGPGEAARGAGYAEALRFVFAGWRGMEFGEDLLLGLHARLFRRSADEGVRRGRYRTAPDSPPAFFRGGMESPALRPAEPHLVPEAMTRLTRWTASRLAARDFHPLLVIASFLLEFLAVRPFSRGNGEMSRLLAAFLLLREGYAHVEYSPMDRIIADRGPEYLAALRRAQARRNLPLPEIAAWLRAFLDVLQAQVHELRAILEDRPREDLLSGNQRAALALFERHRQVSVRLVQRELGIPRDTARQVLGRLLERNLVARTGAGRAAAYQRPPPSPR